MWLNMFAAINKEQFVTVREAKNPKNIIIRNYQQPSMHDKIKQNGIKFEDEFYEEGEDLK